MKLTSELTPVFSNQKSFYGKAKILTFKNEQTLVSYDTAICTVTRDFSNKTLTMSCTENELTSTTLKHLKEFMLQNRFKALTKKEVVKLINNGASIIA